MDDTSRGRIYAHHEQLEAHFAKLLKGQPEKVLRGLEKIGEAGTQEQGLQPHNIDEVKCSFDNLLASCCPLVIVDEAHNARTALTFKTLK